MVELPTCLDYYEKIDDKENKPNICLWELLNVQIAKILFEGFISKLLVKVRIQSVLHMK